MFRKQNKKHTHPLKKKGRNKMERTYVFNFIFKMLAGIGVLGVIGIAGLCDCGNLTTAQVFFFGGISLLLAYVGIWGATNCSRAIEAEKRRRRKEIAKLRKMESYINAA